MPDMRLIDANALPNFKCKVTATIGDQKGPAEMRFVFWQDIEKAPTIDAVPVVRCRDCIHCLWDESHKDKKGRCMEHHLWCVADGFCHMGEKMDGGAFNG